MSDSVKQISIKQPNNTYISKSIGADAINIDIDNSHTLADKVNEWDSKVDSVTGKGLSSNDYTNAEKTKLAGLSNYNDTILSGRISDIEDVIPTTASTNNKLATIADISSGGGGTSITIDPAPAEDSTNAVSSGGVYSALGDKVDKENGKGLSTNDYTTVEKNKLAGLSNYDDTTLSGRVSDIEDVVPTNASASNKLATMADVGGGGSGTTNYNDLSNKPQIAGVTLSGNKSLSDLGIQASEQGKGLSTEDYTTAEKNKLNGIENNAEVNIIESISVNGSPQSVVNKNIDIIINEGYSSITSSDIDRLWETATGKIVSDTWIAKTWNGLTSFYGSEIWTDGDNIYYSYNSSQYVLNKSTSTWEEKTWNFLCPGVNEGKKIWTDGTNIYYTSGYTCILDKSTDTWSMKAWDGFAPSFGNQIWIDGENIYYSIDATQYVLNKSTDTWEAKTWNFSGSRVNEGMNIWTDGTNIYYSKYSTHYVLDRSTDTWSAKTWNGLTSFDGEHIWTDGENVYYSETSQSNNKQYVLDKSTDTWVAKTWNGLTSFYGDYVWTDGENVYYSDENEQYMLDN